MIDSFTVCFFGHRQIDRFFDAEERVINIVKKLILEKEYVEFLIGRDGDFDQIVSSAVRQVKRSIRDDNSELVWVMPYLKAEYTNNENSFNAYYDRIEVCEDSAQSHPKTAIRIRNQSMVERSDMVICYVNHPTGGAFQALQYALKCGKQTINLASENGSDEVSL